MKNSSKYGRHYFLPPETCNNWINSDYIKAPPVWCSVDLRDGNQALMTPMTSERKIEFFRMLTQVGFKEIEVSFPAASEEEFLFTRRLITEKLIPDDVTIQVITMARPNIIKKTFEAIEGAKKAIIHIYNSVGERHRQIVFRKSMREIKALALDAAAYAYELSKDFKGDLRFEYSPESFSSAEPEFVLDICNSLPELLIPDREHKIILNLTATVENSLPHVYASQVEYISNNLKDRENFIISLHTHNDRGCAVADCELGMLAGGERVEGTLFGNGERTGNADIITLALNLYSHGIDPELDFSNIGYLADIYEKDTGMHVHERQPYSGELVYSAFSGSHQDAIAKGMEAYEKEGKINWNIPYIPIDPRDIGREYSGSIIRINSQSGKGGIAFVLSHSFGMVPPKDMCADFTHIVKNASIKLGHEITPDDIRTLFYKTYVDKFTVIKPLNFQFKGKKRINAVLSVRADAGILSISGVGNGRLDAVVSAVNNYLGADINISTYNQHSLSEGSKAMAVTYIKIKEHENESWGAGIDSDIITSTVNAFFSSVNNLLCIKK